MTRAAAAVAFALAAGLGVSGSAAAGARDSEEARVADILQSALVAHGAEVHRCFERALADTLDVAGKIELAVDVGEAGRVTQASSALDEVKSPVLLACLQESAVTWTLAGIDPGSTVVVPLSFEGQAAQFSIKVKDAPEHGPPAPAGRRRGAPASAPPFQVRLLVDEATMHARHASLTALTIAPANRIAMHRHPGAEALYVLRGHARVLGPPGVAPEKLDEGMAIFIPPNMPHAIENMGRHAPATLLDVFTPLGPERVYRNPKDPAGREAFQVIRDANVTAPPGARFTVASTAAAPTLPVFGGKGRARALLDPERTGNPAIYLGVLEADPGVEVPRNVHAGSDEILYVEQGGGELTVGSEKIPYGADEVLYIPDGQPHAGKFTRAEPTVMVQIFAPAGPESRYRNAPPSGKVAAPHK